MNNNTPAIVLLAGLVAGFGPVGNVAAQDPDDAQAEHCVNVRTISSTEIITEDAILFRMRGNDLYLNRLPHRCPGLDRGDAFMYRTSVGRLCDLDIITTLGNMGFGFTPGISCGLGMFYPVTEEEVEDLKAQRDERE